jgi:hypothetical protein
MGETQPLFKHLGVPQLYNFDLSELIPTSLLMSGKKEPMPSLKGKCCLLEKPIEKMFQGAV